MASHPPKVCVFIYLCSKHAYIVNTDIHPLRRGLTRKQQRWQKNSENRNELQGAVEQSSQLQFIRTLLARCSIAVDSQPDHTPAVRVWGRGPAAKSCRWNSCPTMLPGARKSKHN